MSEVVATAQQGLAGKYPPYPEYKDSGVVWLGDVPEHWVLSRVKDVAVVFGGYPFDSQRFSPDVGVPLIRIRDINTELTAVYFDGDVPQEAIVENNDVLIGMDGEFNVARWKGGKAALNQRVACVRTDSDELTTLLFYTLPFSLKVVNDLTYYTTVKHLSLEDIKKTIFALPQGEELSNIVAFLDYETARIDRLIAQQQWLIELLKEKRQAVISHAVTKGLNPDAPMKDSGVEWLGQVPKHWVVTYNKYLVQLTPKKSQITLDREQLCSFIPMEKLKQDTLILDEQRVIGDVFDGYTYFEDEDILLAKVTPCFENKNSVVARGLINGVGFGSTEIFVLRCNSQINNDFMYYRLQEGCFMDTATAAMTGAGGLKRVPSDVILNYKIALPPIEEQLAIVKALKNQLDACDKLIERAFSAIALMQERRTALISAAVTGKIDLRGWTQPAEEVAA